MEESLPFSRASGTMAFQKLLISSFTPALSRNMVTKAEIKARSQKSKNDDLPTSKPDKT